MLLIIKNKILIKSCKAVASIKICLEKKSIKLQIECKKIDAPKESGLVVNSTKYKSP